MEELGVPRDQRPVNELAALRETFLYDWAVEAWPGLLLRCWGAFGLVFALMAASIANATFDPAAQPAPWRAAVPRARSLSLERRMLKRGFSLAVFAAELAERPPTELRVLDVSNNGEAFGAQGARVFAATALPSGWRSTISQPP